MNNTTLRTVAILQAIAAADGPRRLRDICAMVDIPKSTALGILRALVEKHFLEVDTDGYRLGLGAFEVGSAYLRGVSPAAVVRPALLELVKSFGVTAHFAILDGADVLYLEKHDPPNAWVHLASAVGMRLKAWHTAVGQAQLAYLPRDKVIARIGNGDYEYPDGTGSWNQETFFERLARVRSRGYAVDDEKTVHGVTCIAAAVFNTDGQCCGAMGVSFPNRPKVLDVDRVAAAVREAARQASGRLGWYVEEAEQA